MQDMTFQSGNAPVGGKPRRNRAVVWGLILIGGGLLLLLQDLGYMQNLSGLFVAFAFAAGGLVFLYFFLRNTESTWWAAIPAFALLGLAGTIFIDEYAPHSMQFLAGSSLLAGIGLGFLAIYATHRAMWWAVIPGGVMLSVAATAAVSESSIVSENTAGGVLFFGMGLTFLVVALTGRDERSRWWAFIPAGVLLVMGVFLSASMTRALETLAYVWPAALIVVGGWLLYLALSRRE